MSRRSNVLSIRTEKQAHIFAALGDPTRLTLVGKLNDRKTHSIATLTEGMKITRQAVTKHLTVLEGVGLVSRTKDGRESLYSLDPKPLESLQDYLKVISQEWDNALSNLKAFVED